MFTKFKILPVLTLSLCWMAGSDARSQDCNSAAATCNKWYADGAKDKNEVGCAGYKALCESGSNASAYVACMTGHAGAGDCNVAFSATNGPACAPAQAACK